jgi:hypothetical protein
LASEKCLFGGYGGGPGQISRVAVVISPLTIDAGSPTGATGGLVGGGCRG